MSAAAQARRARDAAREIVTSYRGPRLRIMEVCGTHTHEIFRLGLRALLPPGIELISGPGCPVCVTPVSFLDEACYLARECGVTLCTFGDILRVPGTAGSLADARSQGVRVEIVYTPLDAVTYAAAHPAEEVVFLSVGFETTTPASALAIKKAAAQALTNFSLLAANKTMDAAYLAMRDSSDAYLYPGHVCAITGARVPRALTSRGISGVVAGFTASELLTALAVILRRSSAAPFFVNCYPRVVTEEGSPAARQLLETYFTPVDAEWRGLGVLPQSGLVPAPAYAEFDARRRYTIPPQEGRTNPACRCGDILRGACTPADCPLYGKTCTPEHPVGACMVSREGTCAAWYQYRGTSAASSGKEDLHG